MSGVPPIGGPQGPYQPGQENVNPNIPPSLIVPVGLSSIPEGDTGSLANVAAAISALAKGARKVTRENTDVDDRGPEEIKRRKSVD